ncbi:MAG: aldo/keto reductase [Armatimonadota bacterium]|jgi:predicted aldo/keto reductase-like oxidoreductase
MLNKRLLGTTGFEATEIGLGGIPMIRSSFDKAVKIVHRALDLGVNFLDTARGYRDSEAKMGAVMRTRRDECFLATKSAQRTREAAYEELTVSLKELQTDKVDLWQLHDISTPRRFEEALGAGGSLEAAQQARDEGKCDFIGVTSHSVSVLEQLIESGEFDTIMCVYNLAITDTKDLVMPLAKERGVGVIVMKPLSGGIFFRTDGGDGAPAVTAEPAWNFVLMNPNVDVALAGARWLKDIEQAVRCAKRSTPLTGSEIERHTAKARAIGEDVCRDCRYCEICPEDIPIPAMMQLADRGRAFPYEWPKYREEYAAFRPPADACTECGACEESCPFDLPIVQRLKQIHERLTRPV